MVNYKLNMYRSDMSTTTNFFNTKREALLYVKVYSEGVVGYTIWKEVHELEECEVINNEKI